MQEEDGSIYENVDETMLYIVLLEEMLKESTVWEEITGKESVSTISILAKTSEENIDILLLSKAKLSTEIEKLNTDETTKQSIINAVKEVVEMLCESDRKLIMKRAYFLVEKKYIFNYDDYSIVYSNGRIVFTIYYERYSDEAGINITFNKSFGKIVTFNVGWIAVVSHSIEICASRLEKILQLLDYIESNYQNITNIKYCKNNGSKISNYINDLFEKENNILSTKVKFLEKKGFLIKINEYGLEAKNNNLVFTISRVNSEIKFIKENEIYNVELIARYVKQIDLAEGKRFDTMLNVISYIYDNYDELTNIDYCRKSMEIVDKILLRKKENIEKRYLC